MENFKGELVKLVTYGYTEGFTREVLLPVKWLEEQIAPHSIEDFKADYTWDDSFFYYEEFMKDVRKHYQPLIDEALECYEEDDEENNHLECTWLDGVESAGERTDEYVLHVGTIIIEDDLTRENAELLYNILM